MALGSLPSGDTPMCGLAQLTTLNSPDSPGLS